MAMRLHVPVLPCRTRDEEATAILDDATTELDRIDAALDDCAIEPTVWRQQMSMQRITLSVDAMRAAVHAGPGLGVGVNVELDSQQDGNTVYSLLLSCDSAVRLARFTRTLHLVDLGR